MTGCDGIARRRVVLVMRTSRYGLLIPMVLALASCGAPSRDALDLPTAPTNTVPVGNDFVLAPGASAAADGSALTVGFTGIVSESRCPTNALIQCIWGGSARVGLRVRDVSGTRDLLLETLAAKDTATVGAYLIRLVEVNPMPVTTDPIPAASYRITLRVTRTP